MSRLKELRKAKGYTQIKMQLLTGIDQSDYSKIENGRRYYTFEQCKRIAAALDKLNEEGQEKAAERVEELTEIPRYQVQEPPTAPPQDPPAPQEGKDTTSPADSPQRAQELPTGPSVIVLTMVCPLCARKITGNPVTKTAYCPNCKKSFPLPQE